MMERMVGPGFDPGYGRFVAHFRLKNQGPDAAGPLWLYAAASGSIWDSSGLSPTGFELRGKGARDIARNQGLFRIRHLDPGQEIELDMKYLCRSAEANSSVRGSVISMTGDPTVADEFVAVLPQPGTGGTVVRVYTQPELPLVYFRGDTTGPVNTSSTLGPPTFENTLSVWFPQVQYQYGLAWEFQGWSDGSTEPVRSVAANGSPVRLVALMAPRRLLEPNPHALYFVSVAGSVPQPKTLTIASYDGAMVTLSWPATGNWLSVSPSSPSTSFRVSVNAAGLAPGEYENSLRADQAGVSVTIPVILRVLAQAPALTREGIVDAASYAHSPLSPHQFLAIFAPGIGPSDPVSADATWSNLESGSVGGIDVCLIAYPEQPGKVLYAGSNQLNVELLGAGEDPPPGVTCPTFHIPGEPTRLALLVDGREIASVPVSLDTAGASMFTLDMSGVGSAIALNEDGSLNWPGNPAKAGSLVHVFVQAGADSASAYGYPGLRLPLSVEIAGEDADVLNIAQPEQDLMGLRQVDVFVPDDAPSGPAVPVAIRLTRRGSEYGVTLIQQWTSQDNVTLAIQAVPSAATGRLAPLLKAPAPSRSVNSAPSVQNPRPGQPARVVREL
jgi:uncharacterized protein (TIGR03437 family)